ncbi:hypothetical protein BS47DRAFT_993802 [Hydnum rufescens UP504]|uniref:Uncharacterized protein n=1 Tax=Hydnum rufescens UP504 TaxID=1448309 RepID=A0A9P6AB93_9AGAM|nr:hypothetical protein BS47DRAFT_993802 [Hydnum rufescens UP504]
MQYLGDSLDEELIAFPEKDVVHRGNGNQPPSPLLLDYMYGVAAYKHWGVGGEFGILLSHYYAENHAVALAKIPSPEELSAASSETDDSNDLDWHSTPTYWRWG